MLGRFERLRNPICRDFGEPLNTLIALVCIPFVILKEKLEVYDEKQRKSEDG